MSKKIKIHIFFVLLITIITRGILLKTIGPQIDNDTPLYLEQISNIYHLNQFAVRDYVDNKIKPTTYRMPLWQYINATFMKIFRFKDKDVIKAAGLINFVLSFSTVIIVMITARLIIKDDIVMIFSGYLTALNPNLIYNSILVLTDTTFTFFISLFILVFVGAIKYQRKILFLLSSIILGFSVLTRTIAKFWFLFNTILIGYLSNKQHRITNMILFLSGYLLIITPWVIRNLHKLNFPGLETNQGLNTLWSSSSLVKINEKDKEDPIIYRMKEIIIENRKESPWPMGAEIKIRKELNLSEVEASKLLEKIGIETILSNPLQFSKIVIRNIFNNITSATSELKLIDLLLYNGYYNKQHNIMIRFENIEKSNRKDITPSEFLIIIPNLLFRVIHLLLFIISIAGLWLVYKKEKEIAIFIFSFIIYIVVLTSLVASYDRYRLPLEGFMSFLTSYYIICLLRKKYE